MTSIPKALLVMNRSIVLYDKEDKNFKKHLITWGKSSNIQTEYQLKAFFFVSDTTTSDSSGSPDSLPDTSDIENEGKTDKDKTVKGKTACQLHHIIITWSCIQTDYWVSSRQFFILCFVRMFPLKGCTDAWKICVVCCKRFLLQKKSSLPLPIFTFVGVITVVSEISLVLDV